MHKMFEALSPGLMVTARPGDVDDSANQVPLLGFLLCSRFYTMGLETIRRRIQCACAYWILSNRWWTY